MSAPDALVPLLRGSLERMRELQRFLERRGIRSEVRRPGGDGGDCGSGG